MKVDNDFGVNLLPLERGSCAAKFRLLLLPQQQQRHFDSTILRFEILNVAANFAVTTRINFFCYLSTFIVESTHLSVLRGKKLCKLRYNFFLVCFLKNREISDIVHSYCSFGLAPWANF